MWFGVGELPRVGSSSPSRRVLRTRAVSVVRKQDIIKRQFLVTQLVHDIALGYPYL